MNFRVQGKGQSRSWEILENKTLTIVTDLGINFLLPKENRIPEAKYPKVNTHQQMLIHMDNETQFCYIIN
jgi:hypothetical protein